MATSTAVSKIQDWADWFETTASVMPEEERMALYPEVLRFVADLRQAHLLLNQYEEDQK